MAAQPEDVDLLAEMESCCGLFRILEGEDELTRFEDPGTHTVRSFCARCGTPIAYCSGPLVPLKGFPGVVWERPRRAKRRDPGGF